MFKIDLGGYVNSDIVIIIQALNFKPNEQKYWINYALVDYQILSTKVYISQYDYKEVL